MSCKHCPFMACALLLFLLHLIGSRLPLLAALLPGSDCMPPSPTCGSFCGGCMGEYYKSALLGPYGLPTTTYRRIPVAFRRTHYRDSSNQFTADPAPTTTTPTRRATHLPAIPPPGCAAFAPPAMACFLHGTTWVWRTFPFLCLLPNTTMPPGCLTHCTGGCWGIPTHFTCSTCDLPALPPPLATSGSSYS